jgi:hypothetical protein
VITARPPAAVVVVYDVNDEPAQRFGEIVDALRPTAAVTATTATGGSHRHTSNAVYLGRCCVSRGSRNTTLATTTATTACHERTPTGPDLGVDSATTGLFFLVSGRLS